MTDTTIQSTTGQLETIVAHTKWSTLCGEIRTVPWQKIIIYDLLLLCCGLLVCKIQTIVHEIGHVLAAYSAGRDVYAIIFDHPFVPAAGVTFNNRSYSSLSDILISVSGVSVGSLSGLFVLMILPRLRRFGVLHLTALLYAGAAILQSIFYPIYGYYGNFGDFREWRDLFGPWGEIVWPILILFCLPIGYSLGRIYIRVQDQYIPPRSSLERRLITCFTIGVMYSFCIPANAVLEPKVPMLIAGTLAGLGGILAIHKTPVTSGLVPVCRLLSYRSFIAPVILVLAIESVLWANGGILRMPHASNIAVSTIPYADEPLTKAKSPLLFLDADPQGNIYWTSPANHLLERYNTRTKSIETLRHDLKCPLRLRYHNGAIFVAEYDDELRISHIGRYDLATGHYAKILQGLKLVGGIYISPSGDIYFIDSRSSLCVLPQGAEKKKVIRDDLTDALAICISPDGWIYVGIQKSGLGERGSLIRISQDGKQQETIATRISEPNDIDCDSKGNIYVAGRGCHSITMYPASGEAPTEIRGGFSVWSLTLLSNGNIAYFPNEGGYQKEIRMLRLSTKE